MKKEVKDTIVVELGQKLKEYSHFYLVDVTGMNAGATSKLRRECFKNEIKMVVVKNTLLHKAFEASDVDYEPLYGCLKGNTAVLFCNTANVPAKMLKGYVKESIPALKAAYAEESISQALQRRVSQLTIDYIFSIIRLTRSSKQLSSRLKRLEDCGLFPLPDKRYSRSYTILRKLTKNRMLRKCLSLVLK